MLRICSYFVLLLATPIFAADLSGPAQVVDGDTIRIGGQAVRLHGIDAPERDQTCARADGGQWACGVWSGKVLSDLLSDERIACDGIERDRYGRLVAKCSVRGLDIGAEMVARGAAHAYRKYALDYVDAEKQAFAAGIGVWQGAHLPPEAFRAGPAADTPPQVSDGCAIKGNISGSGRIYHMPGQRDYRATRIDERKGERWFCTEDEARAAGWRAARR